MNIVIVGCGRMGQGIALTYALSGYSVHLLDAKARRPKKFLELLDQTQKDLYETLNILHKIDLIKKLDSTELYFFDPSKKLLYTK